MRRRRIALMALTMALSGCASARFYPVEGPLSMQKPMPVLKGKISGAFYSGSMSVTMPDGEACQGHWAAMPQQTDKNATTADIATNMEMARIWDQLYGQQFYTAHVL